MRNCALTIFSFVALAAFPMVVSAGDMDSPVIVPEPTARAVHFHYTGLGIWVAWQVWAIVLPLVWIVSGASTRLSAWLGRFRYFPRVAAFSAIYYLGSILVGIAWTVYLGYIRPHDYGISNETPAHFISYELKSTAIGLAMYVAMFVGIYFLIRFRPRSWWFWASLASVPLSLLFAFVMPIWIDPIFHKYGPMKDQGLEARVVDLVERAGVDGMRVYEVDMSKETNTVNASVTGLLGTKRIVLWDTLLKELAPDEVLAVVAHEAGHYVLNHVFQGVLIGVGLVFFGLAAVAAAARRAVPGMTARFGIHRLDDPASLPVLALIAQVVTFALMPLGYAVSRHVEHEADRFALELTHDNGAAARAFVALQQSNLGYPRPSAFHVVFRSSHPSLGERIDFCNTYRPWLDGRPTVYGSLFRNPIAPQPPLSVAPLGEPR